MKVISFTRILRRYNGLMEFVLHNCQRESTQQKTSYKMVADFIRGYTLFGKRMSLHNRSVGAPAALVARTCFCATLLPFPVVKAWSWSVKEKSSAEESPIQRFAKNLRLKNEKMTAAERTALVELLFKADDLYKNGEQADYKRVYAMLEEHKDKKEPELQWRLARIMYEMAKEEKSSTERANLMKGAFEIITKALEDDEGNFAVHKWVAILLNEVSVLKGLTEQITQSFNVKKHIMRAVELNPNDPTAHYMLGSWCFSVAEVPWYQKKVAATIFAAPPESSFAEALEHFKRAEEIQKGFYSMNHLMLAKTYIYLGDLKSAAPYLKLLEKRKVRTDEDFKAKSEAVELIKKHYKSQKHFEEVLKTIQEIEVEVQ